MDNAWIAVIGTLAGVAITAVSGAAERQTLVAAAERTSDAWSLATLGR